MMKPLGPRYKHLASPGVAAVLSGWAPRLIYDPRVSMLILVYTRICISLGLKYACACAQDAGGARRCPGDSRGNSLMTYKSDRLIQRIV